jgi:drug/metabolite transporter (DMT)-like permease
MWLYLRTASVRGVPVVVLGVVMLVIQAFVFFGPPPTSEKAAAWTALAAYAVFAGIIARLERPPRPGSQGAASGA